MPDAWTLSETVFRASVARACEGPLTLGSGHPHVRGLLEEHLDDAPQHTAPMRAPTGHPQADRSAADLESITADERLAI